METVFVIFWIIAGLLSLGLPVLAIVSLALRKKGGRFTRFFIGVRFLSECIFVGILPGIGIALTNDECGEHPFELISIPTAYTSWIIFALAYFLSKYLKNRLSPVALSLSACAMSGGVIYCVFICIHFIPMAGVIIFPGFNLLYLSPLFCVYFLTREIINLNLFFKKNLSPNSCTTKLEIFNGWLYKHHLGFSFIFTLPLLLLLQAILYLFGQRPDSLISQFTDSCGFLLSQYQSCSCGGDHAVFPLAFICGPIRGIPFFHRLIDCAFGIGGFILLYWIYRLTNKIEKRTKI